MFRDQRCWGGCPGPFVGCPVWTERARFGGIVTPPDTDTSFASRWDWRALWWWLAALGLIAAIFVAYRGAVRAPFVFDDHGSVTDNPTIRSLWPLSGPLAPPPGGVPVSGRPLPNLSFALNYAISGTEVWSYHLGNIALHLLTALTLCSLLRRTLARPVLPERIRGDAAPIAFAVAALWALHPLATAAVTYVSQRTELMVSLCFVLTLLAVGRAAEGGRRRGWWSAAAVLACTAGMASKEVMVSAPLVALFYDRTFHAGSFAAAWRSRWRLHVGLAASWLLLGYLVWSTRGRGGTAGFGLEMTPLSYALTQGPAITRYLGLVFWPGDLVFDYGMHLAHGVRAIAPGLAVVGGLCAATLVALRRRPAAGFAGLVFFAVLAPTSSFVPVATQTMGEHRMYLPLGVVVTVVVAGLWSRFGRRLLVPAAVLAVAGGVATAVRNADYATEERLLRDSLRKWPDNARAHNNLASILLARGEAAEGVAALKEALRLDPRYVDALRNLSRAELLAGRSDEAVARAEEAQRLDLDSAAGWGVVATAQQAAGRWGSAKTAWLEALQRRPAWPEARLQLGAVLARLGDPDAAVGEYTEALRLRPGWDKARLALAEELAQLGRAEEALAQVEAAVRADPASAEALLARANLLFGLERFAEAEAAGRALVRIRAEYPGARFALGNALLALGRSAEALAEFEAAARSDGESAALLCSRALALLDLGRAGEAAAAVDAALKTDPTHGPAQELRRSIRESGS